MSQLSPTLLHMPWHIKESILDSSDLITRLRLRKCCKSLRTFIDKTRMTYLSMTFTKSEEMISLHIQGKFSGWYVCGKVREGETLRIDYHYHPNGCIMRKGSWEKFMEGVSPSEMAASDFRSLNSGSKVQVHQIRFEQIHNYGVFLPPNHKEIDFSDIFTALHSALIKEKQLCVEELQVCFDLSEDQLMCILPLLQPGTLGVLKLAPTGRLPEMNRVIDSEQWKQVELLRLTTDDCTPSRLSQFQNIGLDNVLLSLEDVKTLIENAIRHGEKFNKIMSFNPRYVDFPAVSEYVVDFPELNVDGIDGRHIPIPNSNNFIVIDVTIKFFFIYLYVPE